MLRGAWPTAKKIIMPSQLHKILHSADDSDVPRLYRYTSILSVGLLLLLEAMRSLVRCFYVHRSRDQTLAMTGKALLSSSTELFQCHGLFERVNDTVAAGGLPKLPPLADACPQYRRTTANTDLAGFAKDASPDYCPTLQSFRAMYFATGYTRVKSSFHREVLSCPCNNTIVRGNDSRPVRCINMGSYNYLNFASCSYKVDSLADALTRFGTAHSHPGRYLQTSAHQKLEALVSKFLGVEASIIHTMGYDTNAMAIPCLCEGPTCIISDHLNHSSIVAGTRMSSRAPAAGAAPVKTRVFRHNDFAQLERLLADAEEHYQTVIVLVEGLYSMEGEILNLNALRALKEKHRFLLFVDEAHSVGSIGATGRGVREYWGHTAETASIDVYMGTFTKSFASVGGYIAGSARLIERIRASVLHYNYYALMPALACQQTYNALSEICSSTHNQRIRQIRENSIYFRETLKRLGFTVFGDRDSPVIPLVFYNPAKMLVISRELLQRNIAAVVVGYPAVPVTGSRVRFCISAGHTRAELDYVLMHVNQLGNLLSLKHEAYKSLRGPARLLRILFGRDTSESEFMAAVAELS